MSKKYSAVYFDWGGVIADDPGDEFLGELIRNLGASEDQKREIFRTYMRRLMKGQISEAEFWQGLKHNYGFATKDDMSQEFLKWSGLRANPDILALADEARGKGLHVGLITNMIEPSYVVLKRAGHFKPFDDVVASCDVGFVKPEREIYQIALDRFNVSPQESIFIDDKQRNLDPAGQMGFTTILAQNSRQIVSDLYALLT